MAAGGARPRVGGARCLQDPRPGALRPRVCAFAPASESVFPFPQRSPDLLPTSGQSPCGRGLSTLGGEDCPPAQTLLSGDPDSVKTQDPTPSTFAGSLREPDRGQVYRGSSWAKGSLGWGGKPIEPQNRAAQGSGREAGAVTSSINLPAPSP